MARLHRPSHIPDHFLLWDTPCPPLSTSWLDESQLTSPRHLRTVSLECCTGLTFFMEDDFIGAVYAHTSPRESAESTLATIPASRRYNLFWLYVPIQGVVTRFGCRKFHGTFSNLHGKQSIFVSDLTLEYPARSNNSNDKDQYRYWRGYLHWGLYYTLLVVQTTHGFNSAPLVSVTKVELFTVPNTSTCRGILIYYTAGICRRLGECRLAVDQVDEYLMPTHLCFTSTTDSLPQLICSTAESEHSNHAHEDPEWNCCRMEGSLLWSTHKSTAKLTYQNT